MQKVWMEKRYRLGRVIMRSLLLKVKVMNNKSNFKLYLLRLALA